MIFSSDMPPPTGLSKYQRNQCQNYDDVDTCLKKRKWYWEKFAPTADFPHNHAFQGPKEIQLSYDYANDIEWNTLPMIDIRRDPCDAERENQLQYDVQPFNPTRVSLIGIVSTIPNGTLIKRPSESVCPNCRFLRQETVTIHEIWGAAFMTMLNDHMPYRIRCTLTLGLLIVWIHFKYNRYADSFKALRQSLKPFWVAVLAMRSIDTHPSFRQTVGGFAAASFLYYLLDAWLLYRMLPGTVQRRLDTVSIVVLFACMLCALIL